MFLARIPNVGLGTIVLNSVPWNSLTKEYWVLVTLNKALQLIKFRLFGVS